MERRPLKMARRPLNFLSVKLLVFWIVLGAVWIATAGRIAFWMTILLPFAGLVTIAIWQTRFSSRHLVWTMLTTHCPQCGTWPMNYKSSSTSENRGFLICEKCQIEWDLGPNTGALGSCYNNNDLFKNISENIDKQVQSNEPPQMGETFERLKKEGHSAEEARRLISAAVAVEVFYIVCDHKPFNSERYAWNLKRLPQLPWDAQGKELYRV
ncbi:MAG TPA: hypothetical protein VMA35_07915 [Candidatus Sulfopaludibacter sp.]|nr:hypothetical protein [Candidatus Sulfopaludibacter sp.]